MLLGSGLAASCLCQCSCSFLARVLSAEMAALRTVVLLMQGAAHCTTQGAHKSDNGILENFASEAATSVMKMQCISLGLTCWQCHWAP